MTHGFSLVELIVVLLVVSALAVVAIPRFFGKQDFQTLGFFDTAQSAVRYAQKLAIAQRRNVFVVVGAGSLSLCYDGGCAGAVTDPTSGTPFVLVAPSGVSFAGASLSFDGLGRPSAAVAFTVSDSEVSRSFSVEAATGYVHP